MQMKQVTLQDMVDQIREIDQCQAHIDDHKDCIKALKEQLETLKEQLAFLTREAASGQQHIEPGDEYKGKPAHVPTGR